MIPFEHYLYISAALFCIGLAVIISKRDVIFVLMGIELILNAGNLNLIAFSKYDPILLQGQAMALFVIVIAACEAAVALALVLKAVNHFNSSNLDDIDKLQG